MSFRVEVRTRAGWEAMRPTGGDPYAFPTLQRAEACVMLTHPSDLSTSPDRRSTRIVEVTDDAK